MGITQTLLQPGIRVYSCQLSTVVHERNVPWLPENTGIIVDFTDATDVRAAPMLYLLLLEAAVKQDGVVVDRVGVKGVDCRRLLVERLCPGNIAPSLVFSNVNDNNNEWLNRW